MYVTFTHGTQILGIELDLVLFMGGLIAVLGTIFIFFNHIVTDVDSKTSLQFVAVKLTVEQRSIQTRIVEYFVFYIPLVLTNHLTMSNDKCNYQ